jgi:hypothetical protein
MRTTRRILFKFTKTIRPGENHYNESIDLSRSEKQIISVKPDAHAQRVLRTHFVKLILADIESIKNCSGESSLFDFANVKDKSEVDEYTKIAADLASNQHTRGFKGVVDKLSKASEKGGKGFTCSICAGIGDAVIALDAPRNMRLEHTDNSFDYLCPPINQPHQKHPSESSFIEILS